VVDGHAVTVRIGVAGVHSVDSVESWIKAADDAMYAAKEAGRDRVARRTADLGVYFMSPGGGVVLCGAAGGWCCHPPTADATTTTGRRR
jgi:hypothetical protein